MVSYYALKSTNEAVLSMLENGLYSESNAENLSHFIWSMLDEMAKDREAKNSVLGGTDNTSMASDISYEMNVLMEQSGFSTIWEKISEES